MPAICYIGVGIASLCTRIGTHHITHRSQVSTTDATWPNSWSGSWDAPHATGTL